MRVSRQGLNNKLFASVLTLLLIANLLCPLALAAEQDGLTLPVTVRLDGHSDGRAAERFDRAGGDRADRYALAG